jgi:hypothetical protein
MKEKAMRRWMTIGLTCILVVAAVALAGCGSDEVTETSEAVSETYASEVLDTDYEGALDVGNQLALGTLKLEETKYAVTSEQAKTLLPLWQALQGGVTAEDEIGAVLRGIERMMTEEQLAAVADLQLTQDDVRAWMEEQGFGPGGGFPGEGGDPDARATRQAEFGGGGGKMGQGGEMPPEAATMRAQFENMSEEEREAMRATVQAGGGFPGGMAGARGGGGRRVGFLIRPVVELLTERAG